MHRQIGNMMPYCLCTFNSNLLGVSLVPFFYIQHFNFWSHKCGIFHRATAVLCLGTVACTAILYHGKAAYRRSIAIEHRLGSTQIA